MTTLPARDQSRGMVGKMPDHGFGGCDGHHEIVDLRLRKDSPPPSPIGGHVGARKSTAFWWAGLEAQQRVGWAKGAQTRPPGARSPARRCPRVGCASARGQNRARAMRDEVTQAILPTLGIC